MKKIAKVLIPIFKAIGIFIIYFASLTAGTLICTVYLFLSKTIDIASVNDIEAITQKLMSYAAQMTLIGNTLFVLTLLLITVIRKHRIRDDFYIRPVRLKSVFCIMILGITANVFVANVMQILKDCSRSFSSAMDSYIEQQSVLSEAPAVIMLLLGIISAPVTEEILLRGSIFTNLNKSIPTVISVLITSAAFGALHGNLIQGIYAAALGIVLNIIFIKYRSILANISMHFAFNLIGCIVPVEFSFSMPLRIVLTAAAGIISAVMFIIVIRQSPKDSAKAETA